VNTIHGATLIRYKSISLIFYKLRYVANPTFIGASKVEIVATFICFHQPQTLFISYQLIASSLAIKLNLLYLYIF